MGRTLFYEISISSGFAFVALGAYFLFSSNVLSEGKVSLVRTALASLFLGIAVLCRPTLAVYAVVAVLYFLYAIPKSGNVLVQAEDGTSSLAVRKPGASPTCCAQPCRCWRWALPRWCTTMPGSARRWTSASSIR